MQSLILFSALLGVVMSSQSQQPIYHLEDSSDSIFTTFRSEHSQVHSLRITAQNSSLCDARSKQYTGWLDVGSHHMFFWYFESQRDPQNDPLTLWLTGGPGGSSMLGMLQELGPCLINSHGNGTIYNEYSWNQKTNLLFVDQPAGVGFSYADRELDGSPGPVPTNSFSGAADMHIFLQIFISKAFPALEHNSFHISGESYAGHYIPTLAAQIISQNTIYPSRTQVPLKSTLIGNGYVSPLDTTFGYWETLCTTNPGIPTPIFNATRCDIMASNLPRCLSVAQTCYSHPDPAICLAAQTVCVTGVINWYDGESGAGRRNRFDITAPCAIDDFCYINTAYIQSYLNLPWVQDALHITEQMPAYRNYSVASDAVAMAFHATNDFGISMEPQVRFVLESGVDVLFYQGNLDLACNTAGNLRWAESMAWKGQAEFRSQRMEGWGREVGGKGEQAGTMKEVGVRMGERKTRFAFVTVDGSGHMVPQDKPEVALYMLERWLDGKPFD